MSGGSERVLAALRASGSDSLSGEALSEALGVTRAQIWKHVRTLRARGYRIDGAPGEGYRLRGAPDRLYPEEIALRLRTRWLARELRWLETTDSTNRVAFDYAREGAPHGTTVIAETQTAGRGRLGRSFFSPPFQNLYTSVVLRPALTTAEAPTVILAAGVAVAEAVAAELGEPEAVEIKWPNDVLVGGLKTSGILMELRAEATRVGFLVLGIGVNLNVPREALPNAFRADATSLRSHAGRPIDRIAFAARLYGTLEEVLDLHAAGGFAAVRPRFEPLFRMTGRRVRVIEPGAGETTGDVAGVDEDGALRLRHDDGRVERVLAGDVTLAKEARPA